MKTACLAILGPTACGKSAVALQLARRLEAEIISCDSMQVYRGLDIGTAKPTPVERDMVVHHLIDCLDLNAPYDASRFVEAARHSLTEISASGRQALLVGGSGLYARALIYGFNMLPADPTLAARLIAECQAPGGQDRLTAELEAAVQDRQQIPAEIYLNPRRLLRACEVLRLTGRPPWELTNRQTTPDPRFRQYCLLPDFALLRQRIRQRTLAMLEAGWVAEALRAEQAGLLTAPTARQALGYRDIIAARHQQPPLPPDALAELLTNRTVQYARRQMTWFRRQHPGAVLIELPAMEWRTETIVATIEKDVRDHG